MPKFSWARRVNTTIRVVYDALMLNVAMILAIHIHYLSFLFRQFQGFHFTFDFYFSQTTEDLALWQQYFIPYTLISLIIFFAFGFYNTGRFRRFRERALYIFLGTLLASVSLLVLLFASLEARSFPRGVMFLFFSFMLLFNAFPRVSKPVLLWSALKLKAPEPQNTVVRSVLVIGGAGYIGSLLIRHLLRLGYKVTILDAFFFGDKSIGDLKSHAALRIFRGDFRNIGDMLPALDGVDAVVHLGGLVGDPACSVNENLTIDINYAATEMLLQVCKARNLKRFIFASTCSVYGVSEDILNEQSPLNPVSLYARSKIDSENLLLLNRTDTFQPIILRFATVFGASPRQRYDLVVNTFVAHALTKGKIEVFGGNQWRPFVHVFDLARAVELCLNADSQIVAGQIFNVGDDRLNFRISDIATRVKQILPKTEVVDRGDIPDPRNYRVSFAKIQSLLGFRASILLDDGIRELAEVTRNLPKIDTASHEYNNFIHVKQLLASNDEASQNRIHMADFLTDGWIKGSSAAPASPRKAANEV